MRSGRRDALENVMDEMLLLTDQVTFKPFVAEIYLGDLLGHPPKKASGKNSSVSAT